MTPLQASEIKMMETVGQLAAKVLAHVGTYVRAGVTTNELDKIAEDYTQSLGARSAPLNYHGFPKSICTSINDVICHGVPDDTVLKDGDALNIDVTCEKDGFYGDTSAMYFVGEAPQVAKDLSDCAYNAMHKGIAAISPFGTTGDIGFAINKYVTKQGYFAVKEIGGHGIGKTFHGEPFVPSYGKKGRGDKLRPYTCITVEPMINETSAPIAERDIPGSTHKIYVTSDNVLSAQYEHTVLITDAGYEVLTQLD